MGETLGYDNDENEYYMTSDGRLFKGKQSNLSLILSFLGFLACLVVLGYYFFYW